MREIYKQIHLRLEEDTWPPMQPKTFIPIVLIQYNGQHNLRQSVIMTEFIKRGQFDKVVLETNSNTISNHKHLKPDTLKEVLDTCKITKEVEEILAPMETNNDPQFILIEGAPGIGKSTLLKEIAYHWGIQKALKKFRLVLFVSLRDPAVQKMSSITDLLKSFCKGNIKTEKIISACDDHLFYNKGKDLAFLFDGYDEYPDTFRKIA